MELIEHPPILHIPAIPDHILYTWIVMAILVVVSFVATRRVCSSCRPAARTSWRWCSTSS